MMKMCHLATLVSTPPLPSRSFVKSKTPQLSNHFLDAFQVRVPLVHQELGQHVEGPEAEPAVDDGIQAAQRTP
jgi:hypothetical protein